MKRLGQEKWNQRQSNHYTIGLTLDTPIDFAFSSRISIFFFVTGAILSSLPDVVVQSNERLVTNCRTYNCAALVVQMPQCQMVYAQE